MLLKEGSWRYKDWNENIMPVLRSKSGKIVQITAIKQYARRPFQLYNGVLEEAGVRFRVIAWGFPNNAPYVGVEMIERVDKP